VLRLLFLVLLAALAAAPAAHAAHGARFPCQVNWTLYDGLQPGHVTAGANADCSGVRGSLTISVRLLSLPPGATAWRVDVVRSRTFRHPNGRRFVEVAEPCAAEQVRAELRWTLRPGALVDRHVVRTAALSVKPMCTLVLTGPGTAPGR
jgi:hypothetical protein